jgi:hypothetical protein
MISRWNGTVGIYLVLAIVCLVLDAVFWRAFRHPEWKGIVLALFFFGAAYHFARKRG